MRSRSSSDARGDPRKFVDRQVAERAVVEVVEAAQLDHHENATDPLAVG